MAAGASSWAVSGSAGLLRAGSRVAAEIGRWSAAPQPDGRWRISVSQHTPDPYWLENGTSFVAILQVGKGEVRGPAEVVSVEPLVLDVRIEGL